MLGLPVQADVEGVLQYFESCATTAITEEKYFPSSIRRDAAIVDICQAATRVLTLTGGVKIQSWELPCLFNGSGAGKTFINFNALSLVRSYLDQHKDDSTFVDLRNSLTHSFRIFFKQVHGLSYHDFCQNLGEYVTPSIELYFKWFVASQLLLSQDEERLHRPQICKFGVVMKQLQEEGFLAKMDYSVVFAALRQKYNIAHDSPIWIFVAHDEMQLLTSCNTLLNLKEKPDPEAKRATILYQYLMESLNFARTAKEFGIHVLNIYSGTFRLDITTVLDGGARWRNIRMEPLTVDDGVALLSSKQPALAEKMKTALFKRVLSHLGNIPRIWRIFSDVIMRQKNPTLNASNLRDLNEQLKIEVKAVYGREEKFELLLLLAIQGWTYAEASKILPRDALFHANELQNAGLLFLVDERYFVAPILLHSLTSDFQTRINQILTDFPNSMLAGYFTPANFEEFCIGFFTLKRNLLVSQGVYTIPLVEFFKGAWLSPEAQHTTLTLASPGDKEHAPLYKTLHATLGSLKHVTTSSQEVLNVLEPPKPVALWIGNSDPHQDGVLLLPDTLIQFKMKYTSANAQQALTGASSSSFQSEQEKAENSPLRLAGKRNIFVYATNCRMTDDVQKRIEVQHVNSVLINSETFSKVFSQTFEYVTSKIKSPLMVPMEKTTPVDQEEALPQQEGATKKGSRSGSRKATTKANTTKANEAKARKVTKKAAGAKSRDETEKTTSNDTKKTRKSKRQERDDATPDLEEEARSRKKPKQKK